MNDGGSSQPGSSTGEKFDAREIVMGLHWDPRPEHAEDELHDLDAACVLFDRAGGVLEIVAPGRLSNSNGSVIHTGDSLTGASTWDDERIFVFVDALPEDVSTLVFLVANTSGKAWREIPGASCHVSDHTTERECVRVDLTTLDARRAHGVATLSRDPHGWSLSAGGEKIADGLFSEVSQVIHSGKNALRGQL
jgi:tellurium resistance protein TerZ